MLFSDKTHPPIYSSDSLLILLFLQLTVYLHRRNRVVKSTIYPAWKLASCFSMEPRPVTLKKHSTLKYNTMLFIVAMTDFFLEYILEWNVFCISHDLNAIQYHTWSFMCLNLITWRSHFTESKACGGVWFCLNTEEPD